MRKMDGQNEVDVDGQVAEDGWSSCGIWMAKLRKMDCQFTGIVWLKKTWGTWVAKLGKLSGPSGRRVAIGISYLINARIATTVAVMGSPNPRD
jgi:hypothetical protein